MNLPSFMDAYSVDRVKFRPCSVVPYLPRSDGSRSKPCIRVALVKKGIWQRLKLLFMEPETVKVRVDTGCDVTTFTSRAMATLGICPGDGTSPDVRLVKMADGSICAGTRKEVDLCVCNQVFNDVPVLLPVSEMHAQLAYRSKYPDGDAQKRNPLSRRVTINSDLLGCDGILDQALICFGRQTLYLFRRR